MDAAPSFRPSFGSAYSRISCLNMSAHWGKCIRYFGEVEGRCLQPSGTGRVVLTRIIHKEWSGV